MRAAAASRMAHTPAGRRDDAARRGHDALWTVVEAQQARRACICARCLAAWCDTGAALGQGDGERLGMGGGVACARAAAGLPRPSGMAVAGLCISAAGLAFTAPSRGLAASNVFGARQIPGGYGGSAVCVGPVVAYP